MPAGDEVAALHGEAFFARELIEIVHRQEVNVGRIEPLVGEQRSFGRAAGEQQRKPDRPVAEIRKRHDGAPAHAQHLAENPERVASLLQGLAEDHVIERVIGIILEHFVDVALIGRHAARDGPLHLGGRDLNAARIHSLVLGQPVEQLAFAASEIQHLAIRLDDVADDGEILAAQQFADERLARQL